MVGKPDKMHRRGGVSKNSWSLVGARRRADFPSRTRPWRPDRPVVAQVTCPKALFPCPRKPFLSSNLQRAHGLTPWSQEQGVGAVAPARPISGAIRPCPHTAIHDEKMDSMLTHLSSRALVFLFCGRNCGQSDNSSGVWPLRGASIGQVLFILRHIFGNSQNALQSIEMDPVSGIGGELEAPDFVRSRVITFRIGPPFWSCASISERSAGSSHILQFVNRVADQFCTRIAVMALECSVHFQKAAVLDRSDRERNRA